MPITAGPYGSKDGIKLAGASDARSHAYHGMTLLKRVVALPDVLIAARSHAFNGMTLLKLHGEVHVVGDAYRSHAFNGMTLLKHYHYQSGQPCHCQVAMPSTAGLYGSYKKFVDHCEANGGIHAHNGMTLLKRAAGVDIQSGVGRSHAYHGMTLLKRRESSIGDRSIIK